MADAPARLSAQPPSLAVAAGVAPGQPAVDDRLRAADARVDADGAGHAVEGAGAALHAGVSVRERGAAVRDREHGTRADGDAQSATVAARDLELQRNDVVDVAQWRHRPQRPTRLADHAPMATAPAAAWKGSARRISCSTPEGEVIAEQPVKFMAV